MELDRCHKSAAWGAGSRLYTISSSGKWNNVVLRFRILKMLCSLVDMGNSLDFYGLCLRKKPRVWSSSRHRRLIVVRTQDACSLDWGNVYFDLGVKYLYSFLGGMNPNR